MASKTMTLRIRAVKRRTPADLLEDIEARYGSLADLREHVRRHPRDVLAEFDLRDAEHLRTHPRRSRAVETGATFVTWGPRDLDKLTPERLRLLHALRRRPASSIRDLARALGRDYKNVFTDIAVLERLGLVTLARGPGGARVPRLDFERIEIAL